MKMNGYLLLFDGKDYNLIPLAPPGSHPGRAQRIPAEAFHRLLDELSEAERPPHLQSRDALFIRRNDAYVRVAFDKVLWLEASRSYCILHFDDGREWTVSYPLSEVARRFPREHFLRIHRSFQVNIRRIDSFSGNQLLIGGRYLPIGQQYKACIMERFDFLKTENRGRDDEHPDREK